MSNDFRDRLLTEYNELVVRLNKLKAFLWSQPFNDLDVIDRGLLVDQCAYMEAYRRTLTHRISRLSINLADGGQS